MHFEWLSREELVREQRGAGGECRQPRGVDPPVGEVFRAAAFVSHLLDPQALRSATTWNWLLITESDGLVVEAVSV